MTTTDPRPDLSRLRIDREAPAGGRRPGRLRLLLAVIPIVIAVAAVILWRQSAGAVEVQVVAADLRGGGSGSSGVTANGYVVARTKASVAPDLAIGLVFAAVMGLVGGFFPALRAARMPIVQALRQE